MIEEKITSALDTIIHISAVQGFMLKIINLLGSRMVNHDTSKLQEPELSGYAGLSQALKGLSYGSPEYRAAFAPFKETIKHHYKNNDHHPEFFNNGIADMDITQFVEMLCDWKAASTRNAGSLGDTIDKSIERFGIDAQLASIIKNTIRNLGW